MKKRTLIFGMCMVLTAGMAFAEFPQFHLGAGLYGSATGDSTSGGNNFGDPDLGLELGYTGTGWSIGAGLFVDATYAELGLSIGHGSNEILEGATLSLLTVKSPTVFYLSRENADIVDFSLLLKWPVEIDRLALFPLLGFEVVAATASFENTVKNSEISLKYTALALEAGIGTDFFLGKNLFFRTTLLGGMFIKLDGPESPFPAGSPTDEEIKMGNSSGFRYAVRFGVGWRFF
jgi:hypothetical protein